jgi:hypothetical protein
MRRLRCAMVELEGRINLGLSIALEQCDSLCSLVINLTLLILLSDRHPATLEMLDVFVEGPIHY